MSVNQSQNFFQLFSSLKFYSARYAALSDKSSCLHHHFDNPSNLSYQGIPCCVKHVSKCNTMTSRMLKSWLLVTLIQSHEDAGLQFFQNTSLLISVRHKPFKYILLKSEAAH